MTTLDDILEHHGIKGMKWGVRRKNMPSLPESADHVRKVEVKQLSKAGGTRVLSNKEIQDYVERVRLEQQFSALQPSGQVRKFISDLLIGNGKQQANKVVNDQVGKQLGNFLKKTAK